MKVNLSAMAVVNLIEMARICDDVNANINHAGYRLLQSFSNHFCYDVYRDLIESILKNQIEARKILQELSQTAENTAEKIIKYYEHQNAFRESSCLTELNLVLAELEAKSSAEPDLLTQLSQITQKQPLLSSEIETRSNNEPDLLTLLNQSK